MERGRSGTRVTCLQQGTDLQDRHFFLKTISTLCTPSFCEPFVEHIYVTLMHDHARARVQRKLHTHYILNVSKC